MELETAVVRPALGNCPADGAAKAPLTTIARDKRAIASKSEPGILLVDVLRLLL